MKRELDAERTAAERAYKKREKQIEAQLRSLAGYIAGCRASPAAPSSRSPRSKLPPTMTNPNSRTRQLTSISGYRVDAATQRPLISRSRLPRVRESSINSSITHCTWLDRKAP